MDARQPKGFQALVLEIVRGQQAQLDKLLSEIHGNGKPGLRELAVESRERLRALEATLVKLQNDQDAMEKRIADQNLAQQAAVARLSGLEADDEEVKAKAHSRIDWISELVRALILLAIAKALDFFTPT